MKARRKVVAPVTPRIVQTNPGRRFLQYALLSCAFLLAVWFSYDYGRMRAETDAEVPVAQSGDAERDVTGLEQERDTLRQQVAELQQSIKQARQDLKAAQTRIQSLQQAESSARESAETPTTPAMATEPEPIPVSALAPVAETTASQSTDNTLALENLYVEATDSENRFRIGFSVMQNSDRSSRVTGTIWIAVNGFVHGEPRRLSFKKLSPDRRSYVKMGFDLQQDVIEDVVLPEDFHPKNVLIEAKPYGDTYTGTSVKFDWDTNG